MRISRAAHLHSWLVASLALWLFPGLPCRLSEAQAPAGPRTPTGSGTIFKVNVNLVLVEVSVRDGQGRPVGNLEKSDFHVYEDGVEKTVSSFSHDELPLAAALVVDNSSSVAAALQQLRLGALDALALLKPEDRVAIFSFSEKPEMVAALTSDHQALSEDLWALSPWGGSDINDALYEAAVYLGGAAGDRRRAIILVSDNEPSEERTHNEGEVARTALDSAAPVYSIKVGYLAHSSGFFMTHSKERLHDVEKICRQTGGALIDTRSDITVTEALGTIFSWLKQGYTLGYSPGEQRHDRAYHAIEVRLDKRDAARKDTVYARQGYFAPGP